jgi:hypothetical protein
LEESSQNENKIDNNDEIYLNDAIMEKERMEENLKLSQICKQKKILM